jgi:secreted trypsin-like serine protease
MGVSFQQYLEHIPVPVVDKKVCNSEEHYNGHLAVFDICTGARTDKPTCKHDTGAPLMCLNSEGSWKLTGILSHEGECLTKSHPDVFTSTVALNEWISKTIGRRMP